jgi:hypothetical protein
MPVHNRFKKTKGFLSWITIGLVHLIIVPNAFSQGNMTEMRRSALESTLPVVVLPSPNAATLTRTISEHVDLYTGKLNVEIPIYTLNGRNIEVPISLTASANAHKVNDIASWVGMGWHLNAGGMITRVMKNLPDEWNGTISPSFNIPGIGYLNLNTAAGGNTVLERFAPVSPPYSPSAAYTIPEMKTIIHRGNWNTKNSPPDKGYDLQPDEFYFNFGKYSGKFVFENNGNVLLTTDANLFFTPIISSGKITGFTVLTDDGYKYEFGNYALNAVEDSKMSVSSLTMLLAYRSILCAKNLPFDHVDAGNHHPVNYDHYVYEATPYVMSYNAPSLTSANDYVPTQLMDFYHMNAGYNAEYCTYPSSWYLTKITSPTGDIVTFNYVSNGTLTYVSDRTITKSSPIGLPYDQINEFGCTFTPVTVFVFSAPFFYTPVADKRVLAAGDFWHYPSFGDVTVTTNTITVTSKKLKDIVTSQGYKVDFTSTTARLDLSGDKRLDKISILNNGVLIKEFLLDYENIQNTETAETYSWPIKEVYYTYNHDGPTEPAADPFRITSFQSATRTHSPTIDASMRYRMYLKSISEKGANGETVPAYSFDYYNKNDLPYRTAINKQDAFGFAKDQAAAPTLPPVLNKLLAGVLKSAKYPTGGRKEFEFQVSGNTISWNGLRIAAIKEFENPSLTTPTSVKNYTYGTFYQTDHAVLSYSLPDIVDEEPINGVPTMVTIGRKQFVSTSRVNPPMLTRGAVGGYSYVEISQPNNGTYRIEFTNNGTPGYSNIHTPITLVSSLYGGFTKNLNDIQVWYPYPDHTQNDWKRGLPVAEYVKDASGKNIQSTHYSFELTNAAQSTGRSLGMQVNKYRIDFGVDWNWLTYGRYAYYPYWQMLTSKTVREYAPDGLNYRETVVENTYNRPTYNSKQLLFVSQTKMTNSRNEQIIQKFKYPLDYANATDAFGMGMFHLKIKNIFSPVVEKYQYIQNPDGSSKRYTGGILNKYHSDKPLLLQSYSLQPSATLTSFNESTVVGSSFVHDPNYKSIQNFTAYGPYGGPKEQYEESNIKESYLWDHNETYPVAKAVNAANSEIAYSSFEADGKGNWIYNTANIGQAEKGITGKKYYTVPVSSTNQGFINSGTLSSSQKYKLTLWVKYGDPFYAKYPPSGSSVITAFSTIAPLVTINGWRYYEVDIENSVRVEIGKYSNIGTTYVDEVRLFPKNAQMTTYTFDPLVGMTSICDPNNRIVYYEYDGLQRLRLLKDQYGNVTKTYEYNYKQ